MATRLAYTAVATAIKATLDAAGLTGSPTIATNFIQSSSYPRIFIDVGPGEPNNVHDGDGEIVPIDIHAYTNSPSVDSAFTLLDEVKQALANIDFVREYYPITFGDGDYLTCPDASSNDEFDIAADASFSIAAWITPTAVNSDQTIISKFSSGPYFRFGPYDGGALQLKIYSPAGSARTYISNAGVLTAGARQHVAVTWHRDGNGSGSHTGIFYVSGVAVGTSNVDFANAAITNTAALYIGTTATSSFKYVGKIDQLKWWNNTVLTPAQVAAEAANTDPEAIVSVAPTWGSLFKPGTGTSITAQWGSAAFTFGSGAAAPTWNSATIVSALSYGEGGHIEYDGGDRAFRDPDGRHCSGVVRFRMWVDQLDA